MTDEQNAAIEAMKVELAEHKQISHWLACQAIDRAYEAGRAVSISRASQGSRVGMEDDVERVARALCVLDGFDPDENVEHKRSYAESIMIFAWNGYEEEARAAISALSPSATPQAPEDVRARAIELMLPYLEESETMIGAAVDELVRAHLLATPVTVTTWECRQIWSEAQDTRNTNGGSAMAEALRRVLGDRIQISGQSEGPK